MSKANTVLKVLRTGLKRVSKGWIQNLWSFRNHDTEVTFVCLEGAIYGYCDMHRHNTTEAQRGAIHVLRQVIKEKYGFDDIPTFNDDPATTKEKVMEVIKLAIIRIETGGPIDDDIELSDDELEEFDEIVKGI